MTYRAWACAKCGTANRVLIGDEDGARCLGCRSPMPEQTHVVHELPPRTIGPGGLPGPPAPGGVRPTPEAVPAVHPSWREAERVDLTPTIRDGSARLLTLALGDDWEGL
jgi:hypothetical protein